MNDLELAEFKAKEIIRLAEQKAREIVESAKNPQMDLIRLAEEKARNIIDAAKQATRTNDRSGLQDHDLIIRLDTKMDVVTKKVDDLASNIISRIDQLENTSVAVDLSIKTITIGMNDREARIRVLENWVWKAVGALTVANVIIIPVVMYLLFKKLN